MSGLVSSLIGNDDAEKKARRQKRSVDAANKDRATKLAKQRAEEDIVKQSKGKRRVAKAGRRRRVFTDPLGIGEGSSNLS